MNPVVQSFRVSLVARSPWANLSRKTELRVASRLQRLSDSSLSRQSVKGYPVFLLGAWGRRERAKAIEKVVEVDGEVYLARWTSS